MDELEGNFFGVIRTINDEMYAGQIWTIHNTNPTMLCIHVGESKRRDGSVGKPFTRYIPLSNISMITKGEPEVITKLNHRLRSGSSERFKRVLNMMRGQLFYPAEEPTVERMSDEKE